MPTSVTRAAGIALTKALSKDLEFARVALAAELVAMPVLRARLADVEADPRLRERAAGLLDLLAAGG